MVLLACGGVLFVRTEMAAVKRSLLDSTHIQEHNNVLEVKNKELEQAKQQVLQDEEECVAPRRAALCRSWARRLTKMYEKWLAEDSKSLEDNKNAIRELKKQIEAVKASQDVHEQKLNEKADALGTKEDILMVCGRVCLRTAHAPQNLHSQLIEKNVLMKSMKRQILALNGSLPEIIKEQPDDDDWAW